MSKHIAMFMIVATCLPLQGASSFADPSKHIASSDQGASADKTADTSTDRASSQSSELPAADMHTLISADEQRIEIPEHLALKYSGLLKNLHETEITLSAMKGFEGPGSTSDLSSADISGQTLHDLKILMQAAELLKHTLPNNIHLLKERLIAADYLQAHPDVTDALAKVVAKNFSGSLADFADLSESIRSAIAKQLYLTLSESAIPEGWRNGQNDIAFGVSVQDLLDVDKLPKISNENLHLSNLFINDLTGLHRIPEIDQVERLFLADNMLHILPQDAFAGLINLRQLSFSGNQLQYIDPLVFKGLNNLHWLNLNDNQIKTFASDTFNDLHNLRGLYLGRNQIEKIDVGIFANLNNLHWVNIKENPIGAAERVRLEQEIKAASPNVQIEFF